MGVKIRKISDPREMILEIWPLRPKMFADFDEVKSVVLERARSKTKADGGEEKIWPNGA